MSTRSPEEIRALYDRVCRTKHLMDHRREGAERSRLEEEREEALKAEHARQAALMARIAAEDREKRAKAREEAQLVRSALTRLHGSEARRGLSFK